MRRILVGVALAANHSKEAERVVCGKERIMMLSDPVIRSRARKVLCASDTVGSQVILGRKT
jgi:hypothetical protein